MCEAGTDVIYISSIKRFHLKSFEKHGATNFKRYIKIHENIMCQYRDCRFILDDGLTLRDAQNSDGNGSIEMNGIIRCSGNFLVEVEKTMRRLNAGNIQTTDYNYHVWREGGASILRYDCAPHHQHQVNITATILTRVPEKKADLNSNKILGRQFA